MVTIAPPISVLQVVLFKDSKEPFLALLQQQGVTYEEMMLKANAPMATGFFVDIMQSTAPWVAGVATVICSYLKNRRSRKVIITLNDNEVVHCEGLSQSEIESVLRHARSMKAIETQQDET